ncbi:MAG: ABC transporter substrate-binding protein [Bacteroidales bacterium]|nr:ABC transporter substrate-binding protein [Bacteroidales bacterium]
MLILFSSCGRDHSSDENLKIFKYNEAAGILTLDPIYAKDLPHIWACNQIFNSLVAFDEEMNVVPAIAKSWNISDDGMTYTFILRDDVCFHEDECFVKTTRPQDHKTTSLVDSLSCSLVDLNKTRKVVAQDFVYSFNRVLDRKLNSSGSWIFSNVKKRQQVAESPSHQDLEAELVEGTTKYAFYALNDTILKIELSQPFPAFLGILSMTYASVVPKEAVDYYGTEFGRHPVGTGPFKFQYWKEGVKLVFRKNPNYFEFEKTARLQDCKTASNILVDSLSCSLVDSIRLPYLDAVSISFIIDKQVAFMEFVKGKFHFMSGIDSRYKDELLTRDGKLRDEYEDKIYLIRQPYLNTEYLAFFLDENDTLCKERSLALRQAVSYSIDREKMLRYLRNGMGTPGNGGIIPVGLPGSRDNKTTRQQDNKTTRQQDCKTTGQHVDSLTIGHVDFNIGYPYNPKKAEQLLKDNDLIGYELKLYTTQEYIDIAKFVQSALTEVGLNCRVEEMMPVALREKRANGNLPFFRSSWVADYPDAENYLSLFTTNNFTPQGPNYTHYSNEKFDELYQKSLRCNDIQERAKIYYEMDSLMMTEAPVVILFYDEVMRFVNKNVTGLGSNPTNMLNLKEVKIN